MGGVVISSNLEHERVLIDADGNQLESLDHKVVIKPAQHDVAPPANLAEILALKEKRLAEIPEDELSQFDLNTGKTLDASEIHEAVEKPLPTPAINSPKNIQAEIEAVQVRLAQLKVQKQDAIDKMKAELAELEG